MCECNGNDKDAIDGTDRSHRESKSGMFRRRGNIDRNWRIIRNGSIMEVVFGELWRDTSRNGQYNYGKSNDNHRILCSGRRRLQYYIMCKCNSGSKDPISCTDRSNSKSEFSLLRWIVPINSTRGDFRNRSIMEVVFRELWWNTCRYRKFNNSESDTNDHILCAC